MEVLCFGWIGGKAISTLVEKSRKRLRLHRDNHLYSEANVELQAVNAYLLIEL